MPSLVAGGVTLVSVGVNICNPTFFLASSLAEADVGTPVSQDTSAANTVKKAADGDIILGVLKSFENRIADGIRTGAVSLYGGFRMTYKTADAVAIGDQVVSAAAGEVKTAAAALKNRTMVFAKDTTNQTVDFFLL